MREPTVKDALAKIGELILRVDAQTEYTLRLEQDVIRLRNDIAEYEDDEVEEEDATSTDAS